MRKRIVLQYEQDDFIKKYNIQEYIHDEDNILHEIKTEDDNEVLVVSYSSSNNTILNKWLCKRTTETDIWISELIYKTNGNIASIIDCAGEINNCTSVTDESNIKCYLCGIVDM